MEILLSDPFRFRCLRSLPCHIGVSLCKRSGMYISFPYGLTVSQLRLDTGEPCLLRGDIAVAFGYHPVFFMPQLLGLLGLGYAALKKYRRWLLLAIVICITVFISVWIVRIAFFGWRG